MLNTASMKNTTIGVMATVANNAIHAFQCRGSKNVQFPRSFSGACTMIARDERCVALLNLIPMSSRSELTVTDETPMSQTPYVLFKPAKDSIKYEKPSSPRHTRS